MAENVQNILNNCIERIFKGETIEDCLKAYPKQAHELEPLLRISSAVMQSSSAIQPTSEFKDRVRSQLQEMLYVKAEQKRAKVPIWHRRWAVALASILIIFIAGIGTVAASVNALPGQTLYPVKLASEEIRLGLTFSDVEEAKLHIQFAERRTAEIVGIASQGRDDKVFLLAEQADSHISEVEKSIEIELETTPQAMAPKLASPSQPPAPFMSERAESYEETAKDDRSEMVIMLSHSRTINLDKLQAALDKAPKELKPSLEQAIKNLTRNYDEAISIIEGSPSL
ncbi:MAG: DUF5667 domain-containing protein [Chloroflexota bacterium]|nr:DUF5667 domain-containing protein [Chloroflexota bacterium]